MGSLFQSIAIGFPCLSLPGNHEHSGGYVSTRLCAMCWGYDRELAAWVPGLATLYPLIMAEGITRGVTAAAVNELPLALCPSPTEVPITDWAPPLCPCSAPPPWGASPSIWAPCWWGSPWPPGLTRLLCACRDGRRGLRPGRGALQQRPVLPAQLQVQLHVRGRRGGLHAPVPPRAPPAPLVPTPAAGELARPLL